MANVSDNQVDFTEILTDGLVSPEDEGLFARDVDGRLIRAERATLADLQKKVRLKIDGQEIIVNKAVPETDSQGRIIRDENDQPKPRGTTIYDAAAEAFVKHPGDPHPIPTLCHKEHLPPVGVCRVCLVELVERSSRGTKKKFVPACKQAVSDGMEVHTLESREDPAAAARVKAATSVVVELLATDHLPRLGEHSTTGSETQLGNELAALTDRLGISHSRFGPKTFERGKDFSSHMIAVDHEQCIMCGRCVRGCNWVKRNEVIGRSGKGYQSIIAFDLNQPMGESNCVSCAECVISCPTGAMEFQDAFLTRQRDVVIQSMDPPVGDGQILPPEELALHPMFKGIPYKFLQLNALAVVRRVFKPGDILCREGEYGATAFLIEKGSFKIFLNGSRGAADQPSSGTSRMVGRAEDAAHENWRRRAARRCIWRESGRGRVSDKNRRGCHLGRNDMHESLSAVSHCSC